MQYSRAFRHGGRRFADAKQGRQGKKHRIGLPTGGVYSIFVAYDITNWEWTPEHIAQTLLDAVGFIPVIGSLKYADEFADVLKSADEIADIAKRAPELVDLARDMSKLDDLLGSAEEFGELLESAP